MAIDSAGHRAQHVKLATELANELARAALGGKRDVHGSVISTEANSSHASA